MYTPSPFESRHDAHVRRIVREHPFATLVSTADGAETQITHLPLLLEDDFLWGHLARANPHWRVFAHGHTTAIFHGPHAYVSPRWYATADDHVPTWNYAAVHVHGRPELLDAADTRRAIERLTATYEADRWTARPQTLDRLLPAIVAFRLPLTRIEAKFKFNQNRSAADRAGVVTALRATALDENRAVADWIETCEAR